MKKNWEIATRVLDTQVLDGTHNGENLGCALKATAEEWKTINKHGLNSVTTDNASVMSVAVRQSGLGPHIGCFAHILNLATKSGLEVRFLVNYNCKINID